MLVCWLCQFWAHAEHSMQTAATNNACDDWRGQRQLPLAEPQEGNIVICEMVHRQPHLATEGFSPVKPRVVEVWVTDCYGFQASQALDLLQSLLIQVAQTVPQQVAIRSLQVTRSSEYPAPSHDWQVQMPQVKNLLPCRSLSSAWMLPTGCGQRSTAQLPVLHCVCHMTPPPHFHVMQTHSSLSWT